MPESKLSHNETSAPEPIRPPLAGGPVAAEVLSMLHDGSGEFTGSAVVPWRCGICHELIFPSEVHQHPALTIFEEAMQV